MNFFSAVLLGILQGLTEFFPVSSSGHLVIAQHLMPNFEQPGVLFDVMLHFGTLMAVLVYFRSDILTILKSLIYGEKTSANRKLGWLIVIGTIPTGIIGIVFEKLFISLFSMLVPVALMLVVTGFLLFLADKHRKTNRGIDKLNIGDALIIGLVQGLAIIPGFSRSGSTIATGIFRDIERELAVKFSFLLSIPAILGAVILQLKDLTYLQHSDIFSYAAGTVAAALTGYWTIKILVNIAKRKRLSLFACYCWAVGGLVLVIIA